MKVCTTRRKASVVSFRLFAGLLQWMLILTLDRICNKLIVFMFHGRVVVLTVVYAGIKQC